MGFVVVRFATSVFGPAPLLNGAFVAAALLAVAAPLAAWAIVADERPTTASAVVKLGAIAVTGLALTLVAVLAVRQGLHALASQQQLGTPSSYAAWSFILGGAAVLAIAAIVAAVRWPPSRVRIAVVAAGAAIAGMAAFGTAITVATTTTGCEGFRFDAARWHKARFEAPASESAPVRAALADAVARCDVLTGATQATVRERLGSPGRSSGRGATRVWRYQLGIINDRGFFLGGGDALSLIVTFGPDGRVRDTRTYIEPGFD